MPLGAQDSWSNTRSLGHWHKSPGTAGRPQATLRKGLSLRRPGQLVDPAGPQTLAQGAWDSCSTLQDVVPEPEMPGRAGPTRGPSYMIARRPGEMVDPAAPRTQSHVARDSWCYPRAFGCKPESPGRAGQPRVPLDMIASRLGELVYPAGPWTQD